MADNAADDKLAPRQYKAISALLSEPSIRKVAESSGVPEKTIYRWLKEPDFAEAYRAARREATQQAIARLQQMSGAAAAVLCSLMASGNPAAVRLAAASKVLDMAIKSIELEDVQARLEALERAYEQKL